MESQQLRLSNLCFLLSTYFSILLFSYGCSRGETPSQSVWVPHVPEASPLHHQTSTRFEKIELNSVRVPLLSRNAPMTDGYEATFDFMMYEDLGSFGSFSLVAEVSGITLPHGVTPLLVSLTDGAGNEWINLHRKGKSSNDCLRSGLNGSNCQISQPSAYTSRLNWERKQSIGSGNLSVNTFPTCNWEGCAFNSTFFLPGTTQMNWGVGVTYTAKYVIVPNQQKDLNEISLQGDLKLTLAKKFSDTSDPKAIDLNVILVGSRNVDASHTPQGQRNLNSLFKYVATYLGQENVKIKLGQINAFEWGPAQGGDAYAQLKSSTVGNIFLKGSALIPSETEGKALNIYIISSLDGGVSGVSGKINGPVIHETEGSGIVISSFNRLDRFNPTCSSGHLCPSDQQDEQFIGIGTTLAHEIGHYLGLLHISEPHGRAIDELPDTPHCTLLSANGELTQGSCQNDKNPHPVSLKSCRDVCSSYDGKRKFCPEREECEFNHLMWWGKKNYSPKIGTADGHLVSPASGIIMNYSPFVQ